MSDPFIVTVVETRAPDWLDEWRDVPESRLEQRFVYGGDNRDRVRAVSDRLNQKFKDAPAVPKFRDSDLSRGTSNVHVGICMDFQELDGVIERKSFDAESSDRDERLAAYREHALRFATYLEKPAADPDSSGKTADDSPTLTSKRRPQDRSSLSGVIIPIDDKCRMVLQAIHDLQFEGRLGYRYRHVGGYFKPQRSRPDATLIHMHHVPLLAVYGELYRRDSETITRPAFDIDLAVRKLEALSVVTYAIESTIHSRTWYRRDNIVVELGTVPADDGDPHIAWYTLWIDGRKVKDQCILSPMRSELCPPKPGKYCIDVLKITDPQRTRELLGNLSEGSTDPPLDNEDCKILCYLAESAPKLCTLDDIEAETHISRKTAGEHVNRLIAYELVHRPGKGRDGATATLSGIKLANHVRRSTAT